MLFKKKKKTIPYTNRMEQLFPKQYILLYVFYLITSVFRTKKLHEI